MLPAPFSQLFAPILLALIVFGANAIEAALGFGSTIIALALGANLYPLTFLVPTLVPLRVLLSLYLTVRYRKEIDGGVLWRRIVPLTLVGLPVGLVAFSLLQSDALKVAFGLFVVALALLELVKAGNPAPAQVAVVAETAAGPETTRIKKAQPEEMPLDRAAMWLIGGGIMQGLYASGGPMVAYYASRTLAGKGTFRSTLSALWAALNIVMTLSYAATGRLSRRTVVGSLLLVPLVIAGIGAGEWLHGRVNERVFRAMVFAMLLVAGVSLVVSAAGR